MVKGTIIKGIGGFYYVQTVDIGIVECKARGIFRKDNIIPMVGDKVNISVSENGQGIIENILPRRNKLLRPPVSNIDQVIIVFAISNPNPNIQLLDRFLVKIEDEGLSIVICINKDDIEEDVERKKEIKEIYEKTGYPMIFTSVQQNKGIEDLKTYLDGRITAFAGPSGVGKSSLLNIINTDYTLETGIVSKKIGRGKHTTRHVELFPYGNNGFVVDTPGFSTLTTENIKREELMYCFPEFTPYIGQCKYSSCVHIHEPKCAVKDAVQIGGISQSRYKNYLYFMEELKNIRAY